MIPRSYFRGREDGNILNMRNLSFNHDLDKNKYLVLQGSLKDDALLWLKNIGQFSVSDESKSYKQTMAQLIKEFPVVRDKSSLHRDFYCTKQRLYQKASEFYFAQIQLRN